MVFELIVIQEYVGMFRLRRMQIQSSNVGFDQIGKKQMWERG